MPSACIDVGRYRGSPMHMGLDFMSSQVMSCRISRTFFVTSGSSEFVVCFGSLLKASTYLCDCFCWPSGEILSPLCFWPYCLKAFSDVCVSQVLCCSCTSFSLLDCRIYVATSRSLNWIRLTPFSLPSSSDVSIWFSVCTDDSEMPICPTNLQLLCLTSCPCWAVSLV